MYGRRLNRLNRTLPSGQQNERRQNFAPQNFSFHTSPAIVSFLPSKLRFRFIIML